MTITTISIGANNYVSYASVAEADAYLAVDPVRGTTWAGLTTDQKGANLVAATNRLDLLDYSGEKLSTSQLNQWPRQNAFCNGVAVTDTDVPPEIENATILIAGSIALDATQADAGTSGSNIKRVEAGSAVVEFFRPTIPGLALQDETAFQLVRCLLASAVGQTGLASGLVSGTTGVNATSAFEDREAPGLSEGLP